MPYLAETKVPAILYAKIITESQSHYMTKPTLTIGRSSNKTAGLASEYTLWLPSRDRAVSRIHATIALNVDMQSFELFVQGKNGMEVNGSFVCPNSAPVQLRSQDVLQAGSCTLWFLLPCAKGLGPRKRKKLGGADLRYKTPLTMAQSEQGGHRAPLTESKISQRLINDLPQYLGELIASAEGHRMLYDDIVDRVFELHPNVHDHMWIKSAIRHTLALNDYFETVVVGNQAVWTLKPQHLSRFLHKRNPGPLEKDEKVESSQKNETAVKSDVS
jgi:hypothetical protein